MDGFLRVTSDANGLILIPCSHRPNAYDDANRTHENLACSKLTGAVADISSADYSPATVTIADDHRSSVSPQVVPMRRSARLTFAALDDARTPLQGVVLRVTFQGRDTLVDAKLFEPEGPKLRRFVFVSVDEVTGKVRSEGGLGSFDREIQTTDSGIGSAEVPAAVNLELHVLDHGRVYDLAAIVLGEDEQRALEWKRPAGFTIAGHVLRADGSPAADVGMWVVRAPDDLVGDCLLRGDEAAFAKTRADELGEFDFEHVPPGHWLVVPNIVMFWPPRSSPQPIDACIAKFVSLPQDVAHDVVVQFVEPIYFQGHVTGIDHPKSVRVHARSKNHAGERAGLCDASGRFCIGPLPPGEYELVAWELGRETPLADWTALYPSPNELELSMR